MALASLPSQCLVCQCTRSDFIILDVKCQSCFDDGRHNVDSHVDSHLPDVQVVLPKKASAGSLLHPPLGQCWLFDVYQRKGRYMHCYEELELLTTTIFIPQDIQDITLSEETCRMYGKVSRFQLATRVYYLVNDFALSKDIFNRESCSYRDDKVRPMAKVSQKAIFHRMRALHMQYFWISNSMSNLSHYHIILSQ